MFSPWSADIGSKYVGTILVPVSFLMHMSCARHMSMRRATDSLERGEDVQSVHVRQTRPWLSCIELSRVESSTCRSVRNTVTVPQAAVLPAGVPVGDAVRGQHADD